MDSHLHHINRYCIHYCDWEMVLGTWPIRQPTVHNNASAIE